MAKPHKKQVTMKYTKPNADEIWLDIPTHPSHTGLYPKKNIEKVEQLYQRYAKPRGIPHNLWVGTAIHETTLGKKSSNMMMAHPPPEFVKKVQDRFLKETKFDYKENYDVGKIAELAKTMYSDFTKTGEKYVRYLETDINGNVSEHRANPSVGYYMEKIIDNIHEQEMQRHHQTTGYDMEADWAAEKLMEGKKKYGTDSGAARDYNTHDKFNREKIPSIGIDMERNKEFMDVVKNTKPYIQDEKITRDINTKYTNDPSLNIVQKDSAFQTIGKMVGY